jgi:hypothetical protein
LCSTPQPLSPSATVHFILLQFMKFCLRNIISSVSAFSNVIIRLFGLQGKCDSSNTLRRHFESEHHTLSVEHSRWERHCLHHRRIINFLKLRLCWIFGSSHGNPSHYGVSTVFIDLLQRRVVCEGKTNTTQHKTNIFSSNRCADHVEIIN